MNQFDPHDDLHGLSFDVAKSMRYHLRRRAYWDNFNRANKVIGAVAGSAVVVGVVGANSLVTTTAGIVVALFSIFDLVFDFSERARKEDGLFREWSVLAQEIARTSDPSAERLATFTARRLEIEMEEGPTLDVLERRCSREEALARGLEVNEAWNLGVWERRFAQFIFWTPARR